MHGQDDAFLQKLLSTFKIEAEEHLRAMSTSLLVLEKASTGDKHPALVETIFREAHSLKGAARAVNLTSVEMICQELEGVLRAVKRGELSLSPLLFDTLHQAMDVLGTLLDAPDESSAQVSSLLHRLAQLLTGEQEQGISPKPSREEFNRESLARLPAGSSFSFKEPNEQPRTVRIATAKLDSLFLHAQEMLMVKLVLGQRIAELQAMQTLLTRWKKEWKKRIPKIQSEQAMVQARDLQQTLRASDQRYRTSRPEWLEWNYTQLTTVEQKLIALGSSLKQDHHSVSRLIDQLIKDTQKALMLPFSSLFDLFPKLVRDLARDQGKEVELVLQGEQVEIDKRVLEEMKDPLIHLLRNCIDHGIEKPEERIGKQKPLKGTVTVSVSQAGGNRVDITLTDDGAGIDPVRVKKAAVQRGVLSETEAAVLNDQEALALIFRSEVSTSPLVTDISGRGLGLAIVREKVDTLGGRLTVETALERGTTFRISLPVTLATLRGILVQIADQLFIIPIAYVERVLRCKKEEIKTVENREVISCNGRIVSLVRLQEVLALSPKQRYGDDSSYFPAVMLTVGEQRLVCSVEAILGEQEVLIKNLGKQLSRVRNIAGATVLGSGKVVPVLNIPDLMQSAIKAPATSLRQGRSREESKTKKRSILVVEDSITSRLLLKNILESAGYSVKTATDGVEALAVLKTESFDLIVSDVDMPRLNGLSLTAHIRSEKRWADLPVVLVTALASREDRERGIEVGANAYIVKSSFDQSNLLEVIRQLI